MREIDGRPRVLRAIIVDFTIEGSSTENDALNRLLKVL